MLIAELVSSIQKTITDAVRIVTSRQRLKQFLNISLYRNALYLLAFNLTLPATGFIFWIIATRIYTAEAVGTASAILSAMGLALVISNLGLGAGLVRFLASSGQNGSRMINTCFAIAGLASVIVSGTFVAGLSIWSPALLFIQQNPIYLATFIAFTVANTIAHVVDWPFVAQHRAVFTLVKGLIFGTLRLPLLVLLAGILQSFGIFAAWGISLTVATVISIFFFLPQVQPGYRPSLVIRRRIAREIMPFSLANYISGLFLHLPASILPIMVLNLLGAEANAYFYIAWMIGNLLASVPIAVSASLFAEGSHDEERLASDTWRSLKLTFLILLPTVILVIAIADKVLLLFGVSYSQNGTTLLRILVFSAFPLAINYIYLSTKRVQKKLVLLIKLSGFIGIVTLALSYWLLSQIGVIGVGIAWLGSQTAVALVIAISFVMKRPLS